MRSMADAPQDLPLSRSDWLLVTAIAAVRVSPTLQWKHDRAYREMMFGVLGEALAHVDLWHPRLGELPEAVSVLLSLDLDDPDVMGGARLERLLIEMDAALERVLRDAAARGFTSLQFEQEGAA